MNWLKSWNNWTIIFNIHQGLMNWWWLDKIKRTVNWETVDCESTTIGFELLEDLNYRSCDTQTIDKWIEINSK